MTQLTLCLLGTPIVALNNDPIEVDTRKAIALITYLTVTRQAHRRSTLAVMFWPDSDQERSRSALRRTLTALTKAIGKEWLVADRTTIGLDWEWANGRLWVDVLQLRRLLKELEPINDQDCAARLVLLREAAALYEGPFLEGFALNDSPTFGDWQFFQAEQAQQEIAVVWQNLVYCLTQSGEFEEAIGYGRQWLALDLLNETPHQQLMQLYAWAGQRTAALRQYSECARILQEELELAPQPQTTAIYEQIKTNTLPPPATAPFTLAGRQSPISNIQSAVGSWQSAVGSWQSAVGSRQSAVSSLLARPRHNLPAVTTPFVGREHELNEINGRLDNPACRLVTIIGPGGVGKSRLALEVARTRLDRYAHGVYFVPLSEISSAAHMLTFIADSIHFSFSGRGDPQAQLVDYLRDKQILHVLDNFEHVLAGADALAGMIRVLPDSTFLVTSQERLNLQEEWLFELDAFACPDEAVPERSSAYELFVQRARQVQTSFALDGEARRLVNNICRYVGGLALGIELAATWTRLLSPAEIVAQMEQGLDFLTSSLRNVPDRQRSLRAVFEYSWHLLSDQEQTAFARLGVFHAPFAMPAALSVAEVSLPDLLALSDKSLLRSVAGGRYEIPAVLREYAQERFDEDQQRPRVLDRYGTYYLELLTHREADLKGAKQKEAIEEIRTEFENVRRALRWAVDQQQHELLRDAIIPLSIFYEIRSLYVDGARAFREIPTESLPDRIRAYVLIARGSFAYWLGQLGKARLWLTDGLEIARARQDSTVEALALYYLGMVAEASSEYQQARAWLDESLQLSYAAGNHWGAANVLNSMGHIDFRRGDYDQSREFYQQSLLLRRQLGDKRGVAMIYQNLGSAYGLLGDYGEARRLLQESLNVYREQGDTRGVAFILNNMGYVICLQGEYAEAQPYLEESLAILLEVGDTRSTAHALQNLGHVVYGLEDYGAAYERYEESRYLFQSMGDRAGAAEVLVNLGNAARQQKRREAAVRAYQAAVQMAQSLEATTILLDALAGLAEMKAAEGELGDAHELAALVATHPDTSLPTRQEMEAHSAEWGQQLPAAWRPSGRTPEEWIAALLEEE